MEVRRVDDPLPPAGRLRMNRDLDAGMADAHPPVGHRHLDAFADEAPGRRIEVAVDLDGAVALHPTRELARLAERWPAVNRLQRRRLVALEPRKRRLAGRAVRPPIGDLAHPPLEMGFERRPTGKDMAGDRVALDIADAALVPRVKPKGRLFPLVRAR